MSAGHVIRPPELRTVFELSRLDFGQVANASLVSPEWFVFQHRIKGTGINAGEMVRLTTCCEDSERLPGRY